jgi:hypothetical protein
VTTVLYGWLKKYPQPSAVRADEQLIQVGKGARSWTELCNTVESLEATKVTCLDAQGNVLRSKVFEAPEPETQVGPDSVQVFAKLIAEAYEKGTKSYAPLLDSAMQFIERQGQSLANAEREIERLRLVNAKLRTELAEIPVGGGSDEDSVMGGLVAGMLQAQAGATPIGKAVKK